MKYCLMTENAMNSNVEIRVKENYYLWKILWAIIVYTWNYDQANIYTQGGATWVDNNILIFILMLIELQ